MKTTYQQLADQLRLLVILNHDTKNGEAAVNHARKLLDNLDLEQMNRVHRIENYGVKGSNRDEAQ